MAWWQLVRTNSGPRLGPRYQTPSRFPDVLPRTLWVRGVVLLGGRLHFCLIGADDDCRRSIEWKSHDWLVGARRYSGTHREREPGQFHGHDSYDEPPSRSVEHVFTAEDRSRQLSALEALCTRLAILLAENGERTEGDAFRARAETARQLLSDGFGREDLNELGGQFPPGPWWLNPRAFEYNAPREPWQEEVADLHSRASETAIDLRAVATLKEE